MLAHQIDDSFRTKDVVVVENVTFESLLLSKDVLKGLTKNGFKKPSPVQLKAIPVGRCGFDLIVKSKSGTGKTLVFSIIALESLKIKSNKLEVLILSPTREIAVQSQEVIKLIGQYFEGLIVESFIGGLSLADDKEKCKYCHIAVGTPGRIKHLITDGLLQTDSIRLFVLDEADKLMEHSFRNDINEIYNNLPAKKQIITTSATYPNQLEEFLSKYMLSPTHISAELDSPLLLGLKQFVVVTKPATVIQLMKFKTEELIKIIANISFTQCLIFSNYQTRAESLCNVLNQKGWTSTYISAAQSQTQRLTAVNELKDFKCRIMLSTDLTARGIDAANVDLVINYDIPNDPMTYLHRMGRAGRYGSTGICINVASEGTELARLQTILGTIGGGSLSIPKLPKFNGSIEELLKIEIPPEEHVRSRIDGDENRQEVDRSKIIESVKKVKDHNEEILNILKESKNETEEIEKQVSEMDTESILDSLLNQKFNLEAANETDGLPEFDVNTVMKSLTENNSKLSKNPQQTIKPTICDTDVQEKKKENLFTKNKALLEISKILNGTDTSADEFTIEKHLSALKSEDKNKINDLSKKDVSDIVNILNQNDFDERNDSEEEKIEASTSKSDQSNCEDNTFEAENIFQFGFRNLVKSTDENWKLILSKIDKSSTNEDDYYDEETMDNDEEIDEDNVETMKWVPVGEETKKSKKKPKEFLDEEIKDAGDKENNGAKKKIKNNNEDVTKWSTKENNGGKQMKKHSQDLEDNEDSGELDVMKWIPVEKVDKFKQTCVTESDTNTEENEQFNQYFEECSNQLWQNGLSFNSVDAFDDWFYYEWEAQLYAVRNYVQQNIYVSEMARYQNSRHS